MASGLLLFNSGPSYGISVGSIANEHFQHEKVVKNEEHSFRGLSETFLDPAYKPALSGSSLVTCPELEVLLQ